MLPPFYYKDVARRSLRYFSEVVQRVGDARAANLSLPYSAGSDRRDHTKLVERLLNAYPKAIAGMKDSSGDYNTQKRFSYAVCRKRPSGSETRRWRARTGFDVFVR